MRCEICNHDPDLIILLPIKQPDGKLHTMACYECSKTSGHYCLTHDTPHQGWDDNTSACLRCVEEKVEKDGERVAGIFATRAQNAQFYIEVKEAVDDYLEGLKTGLLRVVVADIPLAAMIVNSNTAQNLARPIIALSLRRKVPVDEAINQVLKDPYLVF